MIRNLLNFKIVRQNFCHNSILLSLILQVRIILKQMHLFLANNYNNWQQYLLQTILSSERLEISSIDVKKCCIILEKVIQAKLIDLYCTKLYKATKTSFSIENIKAHPLLNLSIGTNN